MGSDISYDVPPFQRDYSWTEENWEELWLDILGLYDGSDSSGHYMGYLVLQSKDNKHFSIIDGQQRLTTLSILILSGLKIFQEYIAKKIDAISNDKRQLQFRSSYIGYTDPVSLVSRPKLSLNRNNNDFYQGYLVTLEKIPVRGINRSCLRLKRAFEFFKDKIDKSQFKDEKGEGLAKFIDTLVDKLFFTVIRVDDELNAFKVFETLNARGVRLSSTDLLKNYFFSLVSNFIYQQDKEFHLQKLEKDWATIVNNLGKDESFPEFLRTFWNSKNKIVRKAELFKVIKKNITTQADVFDLLAKLKYSSTVFIALQAPYEHTLWSENESKNIELLRLFNVRQPLPVLLACYEKFYEMKRTDFQKILQHIVNISFRYNVICNRNPSELENIYNTIAVSITKGEITSYDEVKSRLKLIAPSDHDFSAAFKEKILNTGSSRNKKVAKYILCEIEYRAKGVALQESSVTIEHILPENPSPDWSYISATQQELLCYRLGNMTLLEPDKNKKIGNASYQTKCTTYMTSTVSITSSIPTHHTEWNEKSIESRQAKLAKIACDIWKTD